MTVFSHGHLYVALSRCTASDRITAIWENDDKCTTNIVYPEVLLWYARRAFSDSRRLTWSFVSSATCLKSRDRPNCEEREHVYIFFFCFGHIGVVFDVNLASNITF